MAQSADLRPSLPAASDSAQRPALSAIVPFFNEAGAAEPFARELIAWGPGPRACQQLILGGKVRAILRGRFHVTIDDIQALAYPVLRHRIVPTFNAEAEGVKVDQIIKKVLDAVPRGEAKAVM